MGGALRVGWAGYRNVGVQRGGHVCTRTRLTGFSDVHLGRLISRPACAGYGGCVTRRREGGGARK